MSMSIGERILTLRKAKMISQGDLAKQLGVSRQAVSKWENDQSSPDTLNLIKLADLLETEVSYLATGRSEIKPPPPIVINLLSKEEFMPPPLVRSSPAVRRTPPPVRWNPRFLIVLGGGCFLLGVLVGAVLF